jgi:HAD superfamily hydrolase (TIGR01509 family)
MLARLFASQRAKGNEEKGCAHRRDPHSHEQRQDDRFAEIGLHDLNLSRFRAAIFDFDETIIDLEEQHTRACELLCREMGDEYLQFPEEYRTASGRRIIDDIRDMREYFQWRQPMEELFALRQRFFDEAVREGNLRLMPGVEQAIDALHRAGLRLAITSSSVASSIDAVLRRLNLRDKFELIVDGSEVQKGKPDPEAYLVTARELGLEPAQCVVFEDSTVGVQAAKAAGMYCIAVRNPNAQVVQDLSSADEVWDSFVTGGSVISSLS